MLLTDDLLLNYKRCQRRGFLSIYGDFHQKKPEKDFSLKLRQQNKKHIDQFIANLDQVAHPSENEGWEKLAQETVNLMAQGVDYINNGVLLQRISLIDDNQSQTINLSILSPKTALLAQMVGQKEIIFVGFPSLLVKKPGHSRFGNWLYEPTNIRLGRKPKPEYKLISAFHGLLLKSIQGVFPEYCNLILRPQKHFLVNLDHWQERSQEIVNQCLQMLLEPEEPEIFISRQKCSLCQWYNACYAIASKERHLSLVPGITPHRYEQLKALNINTLEALATVDPIKLEETIGLAIAIQLKQQAQALLYQQPLLKSSHNIYPQKTLPISPIELYFDIEAEPERNLDYLLGVLVVDRVKNSQKFYSFIAEKPEDEGLIWQQFLTLVNHYDQAPIFHFSEYEAETIKRLAYLYQTSHREMKAILARCVDLHWWVTNSVILPVESYSLKSLANWLGFHWRDPDASGDQTVCWYDQWLKTGDRSLLNAIVEYNEDDCLATLCLKNWLDSFLNDLTD
jgi:predicted RecB family nuclease